MTHIFAALDNKSHYLATKDGKRYFLRVLTSEDSLKKFPAAAELYTHIITETTGDLDKALRPKGQHIKSLPTLDDDRKSRIMEHFPSILRSEESQAANRTVLLVEDSSGKVVNLIHFTVNDRELMKRVRINDEELGRKLNIPEVKTFLFIDDIATAEGYKGGGFLSLAFDKMLTMVGKRCQAPIEVCVSMSAATATRDSDGADVHHIANLPLYLHMMQSRFGGNIILRDRDKLRPGNGDSFDAERIEKYYDDAGKLSEEKISTKIAADIPAAEIRAREMIGASKRERLDGVGAYISSISGFAYTQLADGRKKRRDAKFDYEKDTEKGLSWKEYIGLDSGAAAGGLDRK